MSEQVDKFSIKRLVAALVMKQASVKLLERVRVYDAQRQLVEAGRSAM